MPTLEVGRFPTIADLNGFTLDRFSTAVATLFEPAPAFARRLAALRPFRSDAALLDAAARLARSLPEGERRELINAHPRLGADASIMSGDSRREQGSGEAAVDARLAELNSAYEARFGFRYVIFVADRPRSALISEFEAALGREPEEEARRAIDHTLAIAADRLQRYRANPQEDA